MAMPHGGFMGRGRLRAHRHGLSQCGNWQSRSVALGQERPICSARALSAIPPIATKLLDYCNGALGQLRGHPQARSKRPLSAHTCVNSTFTG